ncbi:MAG TPA: hypothetical protein VEJ44_05425, partial [Acidimicrobiales bacterium]|nr:hypothetical protein [Acidimicrobiales bacterium]
EHLPVVIVVEDLQWADQGLVDFIDQIMDWSADHPIFLLVLTRPEGLERASLLVGRRNVSTMSLEPLPDESVGEMLDGLVLGLPTDARRRIVERAEGVPLYALETVRMLLDRGVLERAGDDMLRVAGEVGDLDIPPELTALISSRLDALGPAERQLVKECSVLGDTFPRHAVEAVTDLERGDVEGLLAALVRREVLTVRTDKLSPERGQYAFTQSLIRWVAYSALTAAERRARHLRTAAHLQRAFADEGAEVAEAIATHLADAFAATPGDDPDAEDLRRRAEEAAVFAAERADAVGAEEASQRAYLRAADLAADDPRRAHHLVRACRMAHEREAYEEAEALGAEAIGIFRAAGDAAGVARAARYLGAAMWDLGRQEEALALARSSLEGLGPGTPPEDVAELHLVLGIGLAMTGAVAEGAESLERSLVLAQRHDLGETLAMALHFKAMALRHGDRTTEAKLYYEASLEIVKRAFPKREALMENNLAWFQALEDLPGAEEHARTALAIARRLARREEEVSLADTLVVVLLNQGRLAEGLEVANDVLATARRRDDTLEARIAYLHALLDQPEQARRALERIGHLGDSPVSQLWVIAALARSAVAWANGDAAAALFNASEAVRRAVADLGVASDGVRQGLPLVVDGALAAGTPAAAAEIIDLVADRPVGTIPRFVRGHLARGVGLLAAARHEDAEVETRLREALALFTEIGADYWRARTSLDLADRLAAASRAEEAAAAAGTAAHLFAGMGIPAMERRAVELQADRLPAGETAAALLY